MADRCLKAKGTKGGASFAPTLVLEAVGPLTHNGMEPDSSKLRRLEHDPEKWVRVFQKIMRKQ